MSSRPKRLTILNSKIHNQCPNQKRRLQTNRSKDVKGSKKEVSDISNRLSANLQVKTYTWSKDTHGLYDYQEKEKTKKCVLQAIDIQLKSLDINKKQAKQQNMKQEIKNIQIECNQINQHEAQQELNNSSVNNSGNEKLKQIKKQPKNETKFKNPQFLCFFRNAQNQVSVIKINKQVKDNQSDITQTLSKYLRNGLQKLLCCALLYQDSKTHKFNMRWYAGRQSKKLQNDLKGAQLDKIALVNDIPYSLQTNSTPSLIVRSLKTNKSQSKGYELQLNDIVKMGRTQLQVVSIDGVKCNQMFDQQQKKAVNVPDSVIDLDENNQEIQCKYCYMSIVEEDNFFLNPCKCSGFMSFVHYQCLLNWIKSKVTIQTSKNVTMYLENRLRCEVCLTQFPKFFRHKTKIYPIMQLKTEERHLMLKDISQKTQKNGSLTVIINGVPNVQVRIGRAKQNQLRLTDITASRQHAKIQYVDGKYIIFDNRSKFGTTIRKKNEVLDIQLNQNWKGVQVGKTIILNAFQIKQKVEVKNSQKPVAMQEELKQNQDENTNMYSNKLSQEGAIKDKEQHYSKFIYRDLQQRKLEDKQKQRKERQKIIKQFEQQIELIQKRNQRSQDSQNNIINPSLNLNNSRAKNLNNSSHREQAEVEQQDLQEQQDQQEQYDQQGGEQLEGHEQQEEEQDENQSDD